jgi:hypothetical protein
VRKEKFKMERPGLVSQGDEVEITEYANGNLYSYIIKPAVAMSGIYKTQERIQDRKGIVAEVMETDRGYYVVVEFQQ